MKLHTFSVAVVLAFIATRAHATPSDATLSGADLQKSTRCLLAGDLAGYMHSDLQKSQQLDPDLPARWAPYFDKLQVPVKYLVFAQLRFANARPSAAMGLAQDVSAYCISEELPELKNNVPRSCYALTKAVEMFFEARRRGKSSEEILASLTIAESMTRSPPEDRVRQRQAVNYAFSIPIEMEQTVYGRIGYFGACLLTAGYVYGKPSADDR